MRRLITVALILAACGGGSEATTTTESAAPPETIIPPETAQLVIDTARNQAGTEIATEEEWLAIGEAACRDGAWDWGVARVMAADLLASKPAVEGVTHDSLSQVIWIMAVTGCRDRFPAGAIERGPPDPQGF